MSFSSPIAVGTQMDAITGQSTLSTLGVEAGLKLDAINKKLQMESTLNDIFEDLSDVVESNGTQALEVPNAIFMKLGAQPTGARTVTVPILRPLANALTVGAGTPIGNEESQRLKYATFYYNEFSHAVPKSEWGILKNDMDMYGVFDKIQPQLSRFMKEVRGQRIREASLRKHDAVVAALSGVSQAWNSNWFVPNTDLGSMPTYDSTLNNFTTNIVTALNAAGGTDGTNAVADMDYFHALSYYAANVARIDPIMIGGKPMYVVLLPSTQVSMLRRNSAGELGAVWTSMNRQNDNIMKYDGVIGVIDNLIIVEDQRYAEIEVTGAAAISAYYLYPGNNDLRQKTAYNSTGEKHWDIGMLYGAMSVCEWEVKGLHFEQEKQNYGRETGVGVFGESGISIVEYDVDTPADTTRLNVGSIVLPFATPSFTS